MTREVVFAGKLIDVVVDDGTEIVVHGPVVAIVAVDRDDRIALVRQRRPAVGGRLLELPAGGIEAGESPLEAARRELREETGLHGGSWVEAAAIYSTPGYCDERVHVFVATGLDHGTAEPDAGEQVELVLRSVDELPAVLAEIEDAKTLAGLLLFLRLRA